MGHQRLSIRRMVISAIFTALIAVCAQIQLPLPLIPINLALFAVHLTAALLGAKPAAWSLTVYLLLGSAGIPVFAGFSGGLGVLLGKTGGYLAGYLLAAVLVGWLSRRWGSSFGRLCAAMFIGTISCYTLGTAWLMFVARMSFPAGLAYGVLPFLPGDLCKILLAAFLVCRLKQPLAKIGVPTA